MYKNLTKEELKIIRETQSTDMEPVSTRKAIGSALWLIAGFVIFVVVAFVFYYTLGERG